jgi:hypothetical protein
MTVNPRHSLLMALDVLIEKHTEGNPELHRDLSSLRASLEQALLEGRRKDAAAISFRIATWVKFFYDLLE